MLDLPLIDDGHRLETVAGVLADAASGEGRTELRWCRMVREEQGAKGRRGVLREH
jgi:hypothetical protein